MTRMADSIIHVVSPLSTTGAAVWTTAAAGGPCQRGRAHPDQRDGKRRDHGFDRGWSGHLSCTFFLRRSSSCPGQKTRPFARHKVLCSLPLACPENAAVSGQSGEICRIFSRSLIGHLVLKTGAFLYVHRKQAGRSGRAGYQA